MKICSKSRCGNSVEVRLLYVLPTEELLFCMSCGVDEFRQNSRALALERLSYTNE